MKQANLFHGTNEYANENAIIAQAFKILERRVRRPESEANSPETVKKYLALMLAQDESERFVVLFLDAKNRVIRAETMFQGTLTQCSVYPREVVKAALKHNAAAVILAHNHPSGTCEPSEADRRLTKVLVDALDLIGMRVLDHIVIGNTSAYSFAEHGEM